MIVNETGERACHHFIAKRPGSVKACDHRSQLMPDRKMSGPPGHGFPKADQPGRSSRYGLFSECRHGIQVDIDRTGEIKAPFRVGMNLRFKNDRCHFQDKSIKALSIDVYEN